MWNNKFIKFMTTATLAIVFAVTLTGCGTSTSTSVDKSLVIWGFQDEDVFASIIEDFKSNSSYSNLKITYVKKSLDDYYENDSLNSILSGQGPDVWAIPNDWVYRHKDKLASFPDTIFTDGDTKIVPADYFASVVQSDGFFDNKVYAMTPAIDVLRIYYNPTLIDAAQDRIRNNESLSEDQISEVSGIL